MELATLDARAEARATSEAEATAAAAAPEGGDICSLLPVDAWWIFEEQAVRQPGYGGYCRASIQDRVFGHAEGSDVSITKLESETAAREAFIFPEYCHKGGPLAVDIGDAGYAYECPDPDFEYKEGLNRSYYDLRFLRGTYSVLIRSSFPGQRDTVLDIGRQIIDNINRLPGS